MNDIRIASLLAGGTEIVCALGLGDNLVAISHECDFPPQALDKPRVTVAHLSTQMPSAAIDAEVKRRIRAGEPLYAVDVERLASLRPDIVITQSQCEVCAVSTRDVQSRIEDVEHLKHARVVSLNPSTLESVFGDIERIGEAAGCANRAHQYVASLRERVERVRARTAALSEAERPRVACIEWIDPLMLAGNWVPEMIAIAGGSSPLPPTGDHSTYSSWEELIAYDPQVILVAPCGFDLPRTLTESASLTERPGWAALSAVRNHRAFAADGNAYFNRSGPRLVDSLELLAWIAHPGLFEVPEALSHACVLPCANAGG